MYEVLRDDQCQHVEMSLEGLAKFAGVSKSALRTVLESLEENELVSLDNNLFSDGGRITILDIPSESKFAPQPRASLTLSQLLHLFSEKHFKKTGARFTPTRGKDHKLAKQLLDETPEKLLVEMLESFFAYSRPNYSFGYFFALRGELVADAAETLRQTMRKR